MATGLITGTLGNQAADGSPYAVTVSASDGHSTGSASFTWNVSDATTPVVTNPGTRSSNEGASVSLAISASDSDSDALTYSATGLPPGLSLNSSTGMISGTVSGTADANSPYAVTVTASDGTHSSSQRFLHQDLQTRVQQSVANSSSLSRRSANW